MANSVEMIRRSFVLSEWSRLHGFAFTYSSTVHVHATIA